MNPLETPILFTLSLMDLMPIMTWIASLLFLLVMKIAWPTLKERGQPGQLSLILYRAIGLLMLIYVICLPLTFL